MSCGNPRALPVMNSSCVRLFPKLLITPLNVTRHVTLVKIQRSRVFAERSEFSGPNPPRVRARWNEVLGAANT